MSDFWKFIVAVFWHWQSWVGGSGAGGAVVVFVALYERWTGHVMGKRMYMSIFIVVFLVGAFFVAWREQYHAAVEAQTKLEELTVPKLEATVEQIVRGDSPDLGGAQIWLNVSVKNFGAPSVAQGWQLSVKSPTVNVERMTPIWINEGYRLFDPSENKTIAEFHQNMNLSERTMTTPILQGEMRSGWLRYDFIGLTKEQVGDAEKTLYFRDIREHEYSVRFTRLPPLKNPLYIPGSGGNPFVVPPEGTEKKP